MNWMWPVPFNLKSLMSLSIRSVALWAIGFLTGRYLHQLEQPGPSDFELQHLAEELSYTRATLQAATDCETELRSEIRHSTTLSISFRSVLGIEIILGLVYLVVVYLKAKTNRLGELVDLVRAETPEERASTPPAESPSVQRATRDGPIRPSDLRR